MTDFSIRIADWHKDNSELRRIREAVFVAEQSVPPEIEVDGDDPTATHFLAFDNNYAIGTARLLPDGHIGRVAVLKDWRGLGVGDLLLEAAIQEAERKGLTEQFLSAQVHATAFYERHGFNVVSSEFLEAGIPHVDMLRKQKA